MATGHNKWILDGRLAWEPELRTTQSGIQVCTLRLCWSKKVGQREVTVYVNAVCWRALAQTAVRYLHKGDLVGVEGEVTGAMKPKKDGTQEYVLEINVDEITFFPNGERKEVAQEAAGYPPAGEYDFEGEDTPF